MRYLAEGERKVTEEGKRKKYHLDEKVRSHDGSLRFILISDSPIVKSNCFERGIMPMKSR